MASFPDVEGLFLSARTVPGLKVVPPVKARVATVVDLMKSRREMPLFLELKRTSFSNSTACLKKGGKALPPYSGKASSLQFTPTLQKSRMLQLRDGKGEAVL